MATFHVKGLAAFAKLFAEHQKKREARIVAAVQHAAVKTNNYIDLHTIPVAFDELRGSGHVEKTKRGAKVIYDARHAGAVENGSRPHWVPIEPLIAWVKLRGMQGLRDDRALKRTAGTTTFNHARTVAAQIHAMTMAEGGASTPVNAPEQIARAIQAAIAKRGTKPHWFARKAIPSARAYCVHLVNASLADP